MNLLFNIQQKEIRCVYLLSMSTKLFERSWLWGNKTPWKIVENMKKVFFFFPTVLFIIIFSPFIKLLKERYQLSHVAFGAEQKLLTILAVLFRGLKLNGLLILKNPPIINWNGLKIENTIKYLWNSNSMHV